MGYRLKREALAPIELLVTSLSHDGRGVARHDGKTVFVDGALPGERVIAKRFKLHRQYDEAKLVEVLDAAPERVPPRCSVFGTCGGCALQHLAPERQVELKAAHLAEELKRIGKIEPAAWLPPLMAHPWNYRRRARLGARHVPARDRVLVGFRERASPWVTAIERCEVLAHPVDALVVPLGELLGRLSIRARVPQVEVAIGEDRTVLVLRVLDPPTPDDLDRLRAFAGGHGVEFWLQPGGYDTVAPLDGEARPLAYRLPEFDLTLEFTPADFVQVNGPLNERMVVRAVELLAVEPGHVVLDLFCGLGNFTLALARRAARVAGVEGEAALVARARRNAELNDLGNASFHVGNLFEPDLSDAWARARYDRVLLDPPRAGAREVLPLVATCGAERLVYVSCHPGSLARDAGILVHELGFRLVSAGVMDMFPHTAHVESIAVFERE